MLTQYALRTCRAWDMESNFPSGKAIRIALSHLRGLLDADLHTLNTDQLDLWWCSLHRDGSWFCNYTQPFQHPVLPFCRTQYLPGHAYPAHAIVRDVDHLDALLALLLGVNSRSLRGSIFIQSSSIYFLGFHRRLSVRFIALASRIAHLVLPLANSYDGCLAAIRGGIVIRGLDIAACLVQ